MNRLILVGNGFDLAHKMRTGYYDFVFSYLRESFFSAKRNGEYKDGLITISRVLTYETNQIEEITDIQGFLYFSTSESFTHEPILFSNSDRPRRSRTEQVKKTYKFEITSSFFNHLIKHCCDFTWVDIENEYYRELMNLFISPEDISERLENLNNSMAWIIKNLENYLFSQNPIIWNDAYRRIFVESIRKDEVVTVRLHNDIPPSNVLLLNFNYTDTANNYASKLGNVKINYIHGKLKASDNPLIFGFGDELDESYKKIESDKRKGFLKYIKSFWYFKTANYHNLIRFIESDHFQVYILGHSCGLSDRTMLNMIFEHKNCKSIKIFYHTTSNGDNYTDLTEEISRHFQNKTDMRKKIISKEQSQEMPQVT